MIIRGQADVFITQLDINEVWELKDIQIPLSETEMKHLILTGKNGSGKTTVLNAAKTYLKHFITNKTEVQGIRENIKLHKIALGKTKEQNERSGHGYQIGKLTEEINLTTGGVDLHYGSDNNVNSIHKNDEYVFSFFDAKRTSSIKEVEGISKLDLKDNYPIDEKVNKDFLQYIVNLKAQRSFAKDDGETETAYNIDVWFDNFIGALQDIYEDPGLQLIFDRLNFNFLIRLSNGVEFDFSQLSDGYSAIISIISELILRMEKLSPISYDLQGVVLIDEIETHLHVDLQKKILPFLTTFFPRIQFIVTTHSPFVISSIENAVVYDLERKIRVEDASGYSYDTIIESYFDSDKYSEALKAKVSEYEALVQLQGRSTEQEIRLIELEKYFDNLPMQLSPELAVKVQQLRLARL